MRRRSQVMTNSRHLRPATCARLLLAPDRWNHLPTREPTAPPTASPAPPSTSTPSPNPKTPSSRSQASSASSATYRVPFGLTHSGRAQHLLHSMAHRLRPASAFCTFFESALTPIHPSAVDLKQVDFSHETGKVMKLDLRRQPAKRLLRQHRQRLRNPPNPSHFLGLPETRFSLTNTSRSIDTTLGPERICSSQRRKSKSKVLRSKTLHTFDRGWGRHTPRQAILRSNMLKSQGC